MQVERRAFRMAEISTGNPEDALDIVQDAMMTLVRKYADKPSAEWGPLFHRILQSRITDFHRKNNLRSKWRVWLGGGKDEEENSTDPIQEVADPTGIAPDAQLNFDEAGDAIERAINALPLRQQQAFMLRAWEGLDVAETARVMECSEGSVKTHYSRAIQSLRKQLEELRHES
jgi:RNA polymerase sigma-70 factor (ECF subfamily)